MICVNGRFLTERPAGVQRFASALVSELAALREDVVVLAPPGELQIDLDGVRVERVGSAASVRWEQIDLPRWLRRNGRPLLLNLANRAPLLYRHQLSTLHDIIPLILRSEFSLRFRLQFRLIAWFGVVHGSRRVLTVSEFSRREIARHYSLDEHRVDVVPNAAEPAWLRGRAPVDEPGTEPFVLMFGRSGSNRNTEVGLAAMRLLSDTGVRLVCAGSPDAALVEAARDLGTRCTFIGFVPDEELARLYRAALCFIAPSVYEGFDLPPLEAQCAGAAVIASDIPVHKEVLGDGAVFFPADAPDRLASLIRNLLELPGERAALQERALRNSTKFAWSASAAELNRIIEAVRS